MGNFHWTDRRNHIPVRIRCAAHASATQARRGSRRLILMNKVYWLTKHPYLQPIAEVQALVDAATAEVCVPSANIPDWREYSHEYQTGIALLASSRCTIDLCPAGEIFPAFLERLAEKPLPVELANESRSLVHELSQTPDAPTRAIAWLLGKDSFITAHPSLIYFFGWRFLAHYLSPVVIAFSSWRDEDRWLQNYCPTCGGLPAMSQLISVDSVRLRLLSCASCLTRWRYHRIGCPFCEEDDHRRLATLAVQGETLLRIDYCESCGGYLKTYDGQGMESLMLADWTSLYLDVVACDRGLKRLAGTLFRI